MAEADQPIYTWCWIDIIEPCIATRQKALLNRYSIEHII